jgi:hypothetical protein
MNVLGGDQYLCDRAEVGVHQVVLGLAAIGFARDAVELQRGQVDLLGVLLSPLGPEGGEEILR